MKQHLHQLGQPLIAAGAIAKRVGELAAAIAADHKPPDAPLLIVGILNGSYMFLADLTRGLAAYRLDIRIDFLMLASYGPGTVSSGHVSLEHDLRLPVAGQAVLLVDDIFDTGLTLAFAGRHLRERGALAVKTCVLLAKDVPRKVDIRADYVGFVIPDLFVAGYGLDFDHHYRELPHIAPVTVS